jgi:hypothetical protein
MKQIKVNAYLKKDMWYDLNNNHKSSAAHNVGLISHIGHTEEW